MQKYAPIHLSNSVERSPFLVSQPCNAHHLVPPLGAVGREFQDLTQQATHLGQATFPCHLVDTLQEDVFWR